MADPSSLWLRLLGLLLVAAYLHWQLRRTPRAAIIAFPLLAAGVAQVIWHWAGVRGQGPWPAAVPRALEPAVVLLGATVALALPALGARVGWRRRGAGAAA
jgi:hypothetical protein